MEKLMNSLGKENFTNDALDEQFLLGFSIQMMELRNQRNNDVEESEDDTQEQN